MLLTVQRLPHLLREKTALFQARGKVLHFAQELLQDVVVPIVLRRLRLRQCPVVFDSVRSVSLSAAVLPLEVPFQFGYARQIHPEVRRIAPHHLALPLPNDALPEALVIPRLRETGVPRVIHPLLKETYFPRFLRKI